MERMINLVVFEVVEMVFVFVILFLVLGMVVCSLVVFCVVFFLFFELRIIFSLVNVKCFVKFEFWGLVFFKIVMVMWINFFLWVLINLKFGC